MAFHATALYGNNQIAALEDVADCQVIVMTEDHTMTGMAERVLAKAPAKSALVGLSMGGYCAFEIMRQAPDRVAQLALLDTSHEADARLRRRERIARIATGKSQGLRALISDHMAMWFHPDHLKNEVLVAVAAQSARNAGLQACIRQMTAIMDRLDSAPTLATISCRMIVLGGRQDLVTPLHLHEALADRIQGAELVVVEGSGYLSSLVKPDAVSAALGQWLCIRV